MTTLAAQLRAIADQVAALESVPATAPVPAPTPAPVPSPAPQPPPVVTGNLLLDVAATLVPGEWKRVSTTWPGKDAGRSFKQFQTVETPGVGSADGMGWTERLVEHQGELLLPLMRDGFNKALMVMDATGSWKRIEAPAGWSTTKSERRPFNRWFRDDRYAYFSPADAKTSMGYFVRTPLEDPGAFERYGIPIGDDQMDSVGNFSTCLAHEWGRFFAYTPGGKLYSWAEGETAWRDHFSHIPKAERNSGYAGTVIWNPIKREIIAIGGQTFGGGQDVSARVLKLNSPTGRAVVHEALMPDGAPFAAIRASADRFTFHPVTGEWLMLYQTGVMYRSHDARVWTLYEDLTTLKPWGAYEQYCPWAHLSGTPDVLVMVSHIVGVWLHRLKAGTPTVDPTDPGDPIDPDPIDPIDPGDPAMSAIDTAIASLPVGGVAQVTPDFSFFRVGNYWGIDWTPRMHWHAPTQQLILCEHRLTSRVVAFSDATGLWRDLPIGELPAGSGHWYGWSAEDGAGSIYAKSQKLDIATETWTTIPNPPTTNGSNGTMYAWQSNVNRLARYGGDAQRWQEYDPATNAWTVYKNKCGHGQHALVEFHAAHGASIILGGNSTVTKASLMLPGGTQSALPDCPGTVSMSGGSWVIAHPDGGWMARLFAPDNSSRIFHIRPGDAAWSDLGPFQKFGLGYQSAAIDPVRRVVLLATTTGLHAYKI